MIIVNRCPDNKNYNYSVFITGRKKLLELATHSDAVEELIDGDLATAVLVEQGEHLPVALLLHHQTRVVDPLAELVIAELLRAVIIYPTEHPDGNLRFVKIGFYYRLIFIILFMCAWADSIDKIVCTVNIGFSVDKRDLFVCLLFLCIAFKVMTRIIPHFQTSLILSVNHRENISHLPSPRIPLAPLDRQKHRSFSTGFLVLSNCFLA